MRRITLPEPAWTATLLSLAAIHLAIAGWAAFDHASFARSLAPFGPLNGHLINDYAAASATFGIGFGLALFRPWRTALLTLALIWTTLHAVSHLAVAGTSKATGPLEATVLVAFALMLLLLVLVSSSE